MGERCQPCTQQAARAHHPWLPSLPGPHTVLELMWVHQSHPFLRDQEPAFNPPPTSAPGSFGRAFELCHLLKQTSYLLCTAVSPEGARQKMWKFASIWGINYHPQPASGLRGLLLTGTGSHSAHANSEGRKIHLAQGGHVSGVRIF